MPKELLEVNFLCTSRTTTVPHNFWVVYYYEVTLIRSIINDYYKKSETKVFKQKKVHKKHVQIQRAKKLGHFEIKLDNA